MPDPARLPRELFELILDHAIEAHRASYGSPDKRFDPALLPPGISKEIIDVVQQRRPDPRSEERLLFDLCCISSRWRQVVQPKLYETFTYRGESHSFRDLWLYVRTVLSNPSLAAYVKHLHIRAWGKVTKSDPTFSDAERDMLKTAMRDAGFDTKQETEILGTLEEYAHRQPLMAILLTRLPNVESIHAHVPPWCSYLEVIFRKAIETEEETEGNQTHYRAFQKLSRAEFFSEGDTDGHAYDLSLEYLWPIFYLPRLKVLGLYDLNLIEVATTLFKDTPRRTSPVVDLTMVLHPNNSNLARDDFWTLLDLPETLHKLRMSVIGTCGTNLVPILKERLWPALDRFKNQLSHLDVHEHLHDTWRRMIDDDDDDDDSDEQDVPSRQAIQTIPYCCPLRTFTALKSLAVIPDLLLGDQCEHRKLESHHLHAHLPDRLARLTLYESHNAMTVSEDWDAYLAAYVNQKGGPMDIILIDENFVENMSGDVERFIYEKFEKTQDACFDPETELLITQGDANGFEDGGRLMEVYTETEMVRQHFQYLSMLPSDRHTPGVQHLNTFLHMLIASRQEMEQDNDDVE